MREHSTSRRAAGLAPFQGLPCRRGTLLLGGAYLLEDEAAPFPSNHIRPRHETPCMPLNRTRAYGVALRAYDKNRRHPIPARLALGQYCAVNLAEAGDVPRQPRLCQRMWCCDSQRAARSRGTASTSRCRAGALATRRRTLWRVPGNAASVPDHRTPRTFERNSHGPGRKRFREGARCAGDPPAFGAQPQGFCSRELRGASREFDRKRTVRSRARQLHRRRAYAPRLLRAC